MEPRIQYAKTSDGVSIAYAVFGDGPTIVYAGGGFGDIHMYSSGATPLTPAVDAIVELGRRVILYDHRGTGSSDRVSTDFSLEGRLCDLEAVIERTGAGRFALWCRGHGGPLGIAYTAKSAERVSHLVLVATFAKGTDWYNVVPQLRATRALDPMAEEDWEYLTLAVAKLSAGEGVLVDRFAAAMRSGVLPREYIQVRAANERIDVTELLPFVNVPPVVVHLPAQALSNLDLLRVLASRIPNARLVTTEDLAGTIDAFLREGEEPTAATPELPSGMTAILFADIADSTALTERLGDAAFRAKARELGASLRGLIGECGGRSIEGPTLGDGVLAVFTSAREAIEATLRCGKAGDDAGLPLHLGLHAGDVTREKDPDGRDNVYGGAVNIAARISGLSAPGEVLVSETVRSLARTSAGVQFEDRGEQSLKGVGERVQVWAVREGRDGAAHPVRDHERRR